MPDQQSLSCLLAKFLSNLFLSKGQAICVHRCASPTPGGIHTANMYTYIINIDTYTHTLLPSRAPFCSAREGSRMRPLVMYSCECCYKSVYQFICVVSHVYMCIYGIHEHSVQACLLEIHLQSHYWLDQLHTAAAALLSGCQIWPDIFPNTQKRKKKHYSHI